MPALPHHAWASRRGAVVLYLLLAALALTPSSGLRAAGGSTPAEVQKLAGMALTQGAYADAVPLLMQMVEWYKDSKTDAVVAQMEMVYFNLGLCHFMLGQFSEARTAFETYMKKYRYGAHANQAAVYIADAYRFENNLKDALKAYTKARDQFEQPADWLSDIQIAMAKCYLAEEKWKDATPLLSDIVRSAPTADRVNWGASLLTVTYLKDQHVDLVYNMMPYLLNPDGFAARSTVLNLTALEAGDQLFSDERYRDALWIYRIVYPYDMLVLNAGRQLEKLQRLAEELKRTPGALRDVMRTQESIGELEQEIKSLDKMGPYDAELSYRIARSYMDIRRYRESRDLFYKLYEDNTPGKAEECLYLAFFSATQIQPWDQALAMGQESMTKYPAGNFYDTVSLTEGEIYANQQDWPNVILTLTNAIVVSPKHSQMVECLFLLGYSSFMREQFTNAVTYLTRMNHDYPENERAADGAYWIGMSQFFAANYEAALPAFQRVMRDFPNSTYVQDAAFRSYSCLYGLSRFREAGIGLKMFLDRYPDSKLKSEAQLMLGDVHGSGGELKEAVKCYTEALAGTLNIELYNYASFRTAEMLNEMRDYDGLLAHLQAYIERNRPDSNLPMALFWTGNAYWEKGDQERALGFYRDSIAKYGRDRKALGIDTILEEWVGKLKNSKPAIATEGWRAMHVLLGESRGVRDRTLALRLERVLLYEPGAAPEDVAAYRKDILSAKSVPDASPDVLTMIAQEAQKSGQRDLALLASSTIVADFPETDSALDARMLLARDAVEHEDYAAAIKHLDVVRAVYASSPEAARALLMLGSLYQRKQDWEKADLVYNEVLAVKEWKALWPEALYGRGECARAQREYAKAAVFFERIYVMYSGYPSWTAKAYLARAECLYRLREFTGAAEVLNELRGQPGLTNLPGLGPSINELQQRLDQKS